MYGSKVIASARFEHFQKKKKFGWVQILRTTARPALAIETIVPEGTCKLQPVRIPSKKIKMILICGTKLYTNFT
jgi:hypothetical protein